MAEAFDAYYVWLGIGPEEQPANHYRLLGIRVFEPNPEVIESAADRQMAHLRTFQQGKNARLSQRLLNEVSAARVCLLNPAAKAAYDAQLRAAARPLPRAMPANLPVAPSLGSPTATAPAQPGTNWDALIGDGDRSPVKKLSSQTKSRIARRTSNNRLVYLLTAAGLLLVGGVAVIVYINGMQDEPEQRTVEHVRPADTSSDKNVADAGSQRKTLPTDAPHDAMLAIDWPVADREDARLTIDGKDQPLDAVKLEFPIAQGRHVIQLTRDGFEPIRQTLDIGSQPLSRLAPHWIRKAAVAAADEPTPVTPTPANGDDPAATQPMKKLPVPSAAEQTQIAKQMDETYKTEHVAEKDHALAEKLLDLADSPGNSPAERYMLFTKAVSLAAGASDFNLAFRGVDALDAAYEVDGFELKQKLLDDPAKTIKTADQVAAVVAAAEQVIDQALADERYDTALELVATAKKLAESPRAEARFRKEATERFARRVREIEAIQKAAAVAIEAEAALEKSPDDPAANLTLGRWYCLYKRDWDRGLPLLTKGSDGQFKTLAKLELAVDLTLKPQIDLADGWWDVGQKESGIPRDSARLHAGEIYRLQIPNVQAGLKKTSIEQRLKEIDSIVNERPTARSVNNLGNRSAETPAGRTIWSRINLGQVKLTRGVARLTKDANEIVTKDAYTGAIDVGVVARTEKNNIRLYGPRGSSVIFNWQPKPNELRVTRPDGDSRDQSGSLATAPVQPLTPGQWHSLHWRMAETGMEISADGKTLFTEQRANDLSSPGKVAVCAVDSMVDVKSFFVTPAKKPSGTGNATVPARGEIIKSARQGGGGGGAFDETGPLGSFLVGFHLVDGGAINVLQPIYRGPGGVVAGVSHGGNPGTAIDVIAKDGYAVGAIVVRSGDWVDSMRVVFMRARGKRLDPGDFYESPWYGGSGGEETKLGGDGSPVVGVFGASGDYIDSIGLNLETSSAGSAAPVASKAADEQKADAHSNPSVSFPRNRWVDVLRLVDTEHDAINGDWSRSGDAVLSDAKRYCRIRLPVATIGSYDLEVDFTRTDGTNDINTMIPVGSRRCMIMLSGSDGKASGIDRIDGHSITDNRNPAAIHPGSIESGHRYRLDIAVRLHTNETASIAVSLDGKSYLPQWEGKLASLDIAPRWALPNPQQPGLGAWKSRVTFHAVRLRMLSGDAISESTVAEPLNLPTVISARWGGGNNWSSVTEKVQEAVDRREAVHATPGFLGADPTPGWRKHLEITFEKEGQQQKVSIDEGQQWMLRDYAGEGTK